MSVAFVLLVPTAPPQDVRGSAVNSKAVEITWNPPPEEHQNGILKGYRVRYAEADSTTEVQDAQMLVLEAGRTDCRISDLKKWTQYKVWVAAYTQIGDGPYSDVIIVQTDEDGRSPNTTQFRTQLLCWFFLGAGF